MFRPLNAPSSLEEGIADSSPVYLTEDVPAKKQYEYYDEDEIVASYSQALQLLGERNFQEAEGELSKLRKIFTSKSAEKNRKDHKLLFPVLMNLAECYSNLVKNEEAITALSDACSSNSKNPTAWFKLGCLLIKSRSVYDAIPAFREAVTNCPGIHWLSLTKLCQCLFVIGLYDDCIFYCLKGLNENSYFTTGHTLLLEMLKQEKNILRYNRSLRENVNLLDDQFYDSKVISECENIRNQHVDFTSSILPPKLTEFTPNAKLQMGSNRKISLSEFCRYLARACEEALSSSNSSLIDCPLKVQKDEPVTEDAPVTYTTSSHRLPTTPQQTTRASRLSSLALSKSSGQTAGGNLMRTKLLKYVGQLKGLCDSSDLISEAAASISVRRTSASQTSQSIEEAVRGKIADEDTSEDLRILCEENLSLKQLVNYFLDRYVELATSRSWEKEDAVAFCLLFLQFRKFTQLQPFNSLEDTFNISVCDMARVFLEAAVEFLTQPADEQQLYMANFVSPPIALDLTDEIDCLTMPSLLCSSLRTHGTVEKRKENKIRHSLLFFWLSKVKHNFELMQLSSSCCRSVLSDYPEFTSLFLGHVFRHPLWRRDDILMEMKWTQSYEHLRNLAEHFESKNWEAICTKLAIVSSECDIFDVSNFDLIVASDLAHYSVIYAEALFRCSKENATEVLLQLLACLLDTLSSGRQAPMLKQVLSDAWQLCYDFFDKITASNKTALVKMMISTIEIVFNFIENNSCLPFNCAGLIRSFFMAFSLLTNIGNRSSLGVRLDFSAMDDESAIKKNSEIVDESSNDSFDSDEDSDFAKLPVGVKFLILFHDVLASSGGGLCRAENGAYLELIRDRLIEFMQSPAAFEEGMTKSSRAYVEKQIDQCIFCQLGITLRRFTRKSTQVAEHPSNKPAQPSDLTWATGIKLFSFYRPRDMPAYDSFKGDSISVEFGNFLKKLLTLSPAKPLLSEAELDEYLGAPLLENANDFKEKVCAITGSESETTDQNHYSIICYLFADLDVKLAEYNQALDYYKTAIRFQPTLFDAWAGLALSWQSSVCPTLDECDSEGQYCDPEMIQPVVRSFQMAHALEPNNGKLLMEYGSFVYEIYSLLCRVASITPHRSGRNVETTYDSESIVAKFIGKTPANDQDLLKLVLDLFAQANASSDIDPPSDRWFCLYMLGKVGGKLKRGILYSIEMFVQALELLFAHDAVIPSRTITSSNAPKFACECFELFYRFHADILKFLACGDITTLQQNKSENEQLVREIGQKVDQLISFVCRIYSKRFMSVPVFADFCRADETTCFDDSGNADISTVLSRVGNLAEICIHAMAFCSTRFPEHFKSRYRMAHAFFDHPLVTNSALCGQVLLGWVVPDDENRGPFAGVKFGSSLFDPRKIQSGSVGAMLTGFWRSPHPDFDRRGSFFAHTQKCVRLLLQFLSACEANPDALKLLHAAHAQLSRPAPTSRRYMRDSDQSNLALKSLENAVEMMTSTISVDVPCTREKLLEVYRLQQSIIRGGFVSLIDKITCLLIGCYLSSQLGNDANKTGDEQFSPPTSAEVERFCQNLVLQEKQLKAKAEKARRMSVSAGTSSTADVDREVENLLKSMVDSVVERNNTATPSN